MRDGFLQEYLCCDSMYKIPVDIGCPVPNHGISRFVSWKVPGKSGMMITKGGSWMNQKKTGEFLKHLRKEKGLTQEQLAERFYVSSRTVSRWETGVSQT